MKNDHALAFAARQSFQPIRKVNLLADVEFMAETSDFVKGGRFTENE